MNVRGDFFVSRIFKAEKKSELSSAKSLVKLNKFSDISVM